MSADKEINQEIEEFLPHTQGEKSVVDKSKVGKYKIKKKTEIILFPKVQRQKNSNNNKPMNTKNVEDLQNNR